MTNTNRYAFIRSLAVALVVASGLFGVVFVGAQDIESAKGSDISVGGGKSDIGGGATDVEEKKKEGEDDGKGSAEDIKPIANDPAEPDDAACDGSARENIVSSDGTPFDPWDMAHDIVVENGVASVTVKNISDTCDYNVALSAYKTDVYVPGHEQEYIDSQELYDEDVHSGIIYNVGHGQTRTLRVSVPSCNYQIDLYTFVEGASASPVPPDFARLTGTHTLLDWEQENDAGSCFVVCPLVPPAITTASSAVGTVGVPFTHTITITGDGVNPTLAGVLPAGLAFSHVGGNLWRISGTPTQAGTSIVTINVSNQCGTAAVSITITVGGGSCTILPPVITSSQTASATVGSSFSYTITTTGTVSSLVVATSTLPLGLQYQNGVISGTPTQAGSFTTIITASNQCGTTAINLTITVGGGSCTILPPVITSPQTASATVGSSFSYTITTTGTVSSLTVANLPAGLSVSGNTISGTPTQAGTFTAVITAGNQCAVTSTNLTITVSGGGDDDDDDDNGDDDDDNGGGGGGSRRRPKVVLFSDPEVLGASISLAQIPYTGLGTSIFQLALFIVGLLAISGGIIYTIMRRVRRHAAPSSEAPTKGSVEFPKADTPVVDVMIDPAASAYEEYAHVAAPLPAVSAVPSRIERFGAPANIPVGADAFEAPRPMTAGTASIPKDPAAQGVVRVSTAHIQNEARSSRVLVSDDGAELIANSAEGDEKKALERLAQIIEVAKSRYPREDGWLILDKGRVRESLFISILSMVPLFVEWIVRGEDKKVFTFLRMLKHQEQPVADFMRKVVSDLDNAYRARMEGSDERANVNQHIAEVTYHLSNKELETIVDELLHGVDERYESAYTSVRLSLVRVLDIMKERSLRSVGAAYAFIGEPSR